MFNINIKDIIQSKDAKVLQNYADMFGWLKKKVNFLVTTRHWVILYEGTLFLYSDHKAEKPEVIVKS